MTQFDSGRPDMERITLVTKPSADYELLDSGREEKLERYGSFILSRPDPQALWEKAGTQGWDTAHARYTRSGTVGEWQTAKSMPKQWDIAFGGLTVRIKPTSFKHTGLFPEQEPNWDWTRTLITGAGRPVSVMNLFGYTGGASLAAAQAGAEVTHVDASKTAVAWARENAELSGLSDKPIRWIVEDVLVFVKRELKRGKKYDLILMDPPAFGHGPHDELWKIEKHFLELIRLCSELFSEKPLGMLVNGYAAGYSPLAFAYNLEPMAAKYGGTLQYGDLTIAQRQGRLLPAGIFARWQVG
jgi:23S rRNA (cytosine1962-C5)-methyltransferase